MRCEICGQLGRHDHRCPNYIVPKSHYYCSICGDGIYSGDEYIKNDYGKYAHLSCVDCTNELIKFLGYKIEIMEENNEFMEDI